MHFKWGEQEDEEEDEKKMAAPVQSFVSGPDKEGIKTVTEYRTDENGTKIQVVRKVRETKVTTRVHKDVEARRQWKKFGKCADLPPGPEPNVTYTSHENVNLQLKSKKREEEAPDDDDPLAKLKGAGESIVLCKHCGQRGHWSLKCPKRAEIAVTQKTPTERRKRTRTKSQAFRRAQRQICSYSFTKFKYQTWGSWRRRRRRPGRGEWRPSGRRICEPDSRHKHPRSNHGE